MTRRYNSTYYQRTRLQVLQRDYNTCHYCGQEANTVDHLIPISKGGTDEASNMVACCTQCNSSNFANNSSNSANTSANHASNSSNFANNSSNSANTSANHAANSSNFANNSSNFANTASNAANAANAARDTAITLVDSFEDVYLGAKSLDPSLDNDGDALTPGDLYFNNSSNTLKYYTGSTWLTVEATDTSNFATKGFSIAMAIAL